MEGYLTASEPVSIGLYGEVRGLLNRINPVLLIGRVVMMKVLVT